MSQAHRKMGLFCALEFESDFSASTNLPSALLVL